MDTRSKEYYEGYSAGIVSCNDWQDFKPSYQKDSKEYNDYREGFGNALDDLVYSYGSTGC